MDTALEVVRLILEYFGWERDTLIEVSLFVNCYLAQCHRMSELLASILIQRNRFVFYFRIYFSEMKQ